MPEQPPVQYDRRRDDAIRVPKAVVFAVVLAFPGTIIAGTLWVGAQEASVATLNGKVDGLATSLNGIKDGLDRRDKDQELRYREVDGVSQRLDIRVSKIETALQIGSDGTVPKRTGRQ